MARAAAYREITRRTHTKATSATPLTSSYGQAQRWGLDYAWSPLPAPLFIPLKKIEFFAQIYIGRSLTLISFQVLMHPAVA